MSNLFNQNPFVLDTVWTTTTIPDDLTDLSENGGGSPDEFRRIVWMGGTAGDNIVFTDANDLAILKGYCPVTNQEVVLWENGRNRFVMKQGLWVLKTMAHGVVTLQK